jgi:hypothetical protein
LDELMLAANNKDYGDDNEEDDKKHNAATTTTTTTASAVDSDLKEGDDRRRRLGQLVRTGVAVNQRRWKIRQLQIAEERQQKKHQSSSTSSILDEKKGDISLSAKRRQLNKPLPRAPIPDMTAPTSTPSTQTSLTPSPTPIESTSEPAKQDKDKRTRPAPFVSDLPYRNNKRNNNGNDNNNNNNNTGNISSHPKITADDRASTSPLLPSSDINNSTNFVGRQRTQTNPAAPPERLQPGYIARSPPSPILAAPPWQPDEMAPACNKCETEFSIFLRRHHW